MDTATHAIVGLIVGECAPKDVKHRRKIGLGFGMLPDLTNIIFVHPYLGWVAERTIPFAVPRDFLTHPEVLDHWTYHSWLLTHSLLFWALVFACRSPRGGLVAASTQPLYPIRFVFSGWFEVRRPSSPASSWPTCRALREPRGIGLASG